MTSAGERQPVDLGQEDNLDLLAGEQDCPLCGCEYDEPHMVRERDGILTLAVQCHCCGTGSLMSVKSGLRTSSTPRPLSDLTAVEQAFFASLRPISEQDVGRMQALIQAHRGDLRDLMCQ